MPIVRIPPSIADDVDIEAAPARQAARGEGAGDVNRYLTSIAGARLTAKDFRTWTGTVQALESLLGPPPATGRKRALDALKQAAAFLGNTVAVCRRSYVHPALLAAAQSGEFPELLEAATISQRESELTRGESALKALLPLL